MRAWTVSVSVGELAGFCVPALVGGLLREGAPLLVLGALVLAGVAEGAILGWSQARVLRQRLDGFSEARWVVGTAAAAAGAWFLGMLPSTFHEQWSTWPTLLTVIVAMLLGAVVLGSIGVAQWFELRRHVPRAARWIGITAAGWGAGLVVFMTVATPLWRPGQATATIIAIGLCGGGLMALTMAGLTGYGMRHLLSTGASGDEGDEVRRRGRRSARWPWRRTFVAVEGLVALAGAAGSVQLLAGLATPPDSTLDPLEPVGVSGWELPALWLFLTVALPSTAAVWAGWRRRSRTPELVLVASAMLGVELLVQIPFLGPSVLQAVFGAVALTMAVLAWQARGSGAWRTPVQPVPPVEGQRPEGSRSELVSLGGSTNR